MGERRLGAPWVAARDKLALARGLRRFATPAERRLWDAIRGSALGFRFRRQHVIGGYVVDFYCPACRLAIEVDGPVHETREDEDRARDAQLEQLSVSVLRFSNARITNALQDVVNDIAERCARSAQIAHKPF